MAQAAKNTSKFIVFHDSFWDSIGCDASTTLERPVIIEVLEAPWKHQKHTTNLTQFPAKTVRATLQMLVEQFSTLQMWVVVEV